MNRCSRWIAVIFFVMLLMTPEPADAETKRRLGERLVNSLPQLRSRISSNRSRIERLTPRRLRGASLDRIAHDEHVDLHVELTPDPTAESDHQGHIYNEGHNTTPVDQFFSIEEKIVLMQLDHAMSLYNATNGHYPRSHREFMEQILQPNRISLPPLRDGESYFYDPEEHQLMVRKRR